MGTTGNFNIIKKIIIFLKEVKKEFTKVTFLSKDALIKSTVVVILVSLIFALFLGGMDYIFMYLIKTFLLKV